MNKRHYEHTLPNIRGSLSNTYVYNEYALGYIMPEQPDKVCTLVDRITLGAPFRTMNEPYFIGKRDTVRLAGRKDFDTFRVVFDGYDNPQEYEFDTAQ